MVRCWAVAVVSSAMIASAAGVAAPAASAASGDLSFADCVALAGVEPCDEVGSLAHATGLGVSPDGEQVYASSGDATGITALDRGPTGKLTFNSCLGSRFTASGCADFPFPLPVDGIPFGDLAVDPDGSAVYVASSGLNPSAAWALSRAPDGSLGFSACYGNTDGGAAPCDEGDSAFSDPKGIAIGPDGEHLYVAEHQFGSVYSLDIGNDLSLSLDRCLGDGPLCAGASSETGIGATGVAASPGSASVYVTGSRGDAPVGPSTLQTFGRPGGAFSFLDCYGSGCTAGGNPIEQAAGVAVSPDDENVYVASGHASDGDDAVAVFDRAADGSLTKAGCVARDDHDGCEVPTSSGALAGVRDVVVSPDGGSVYAASPTAITNFRRVADGSLKFFGCVADGGAFGCADPAPGRLEAIRNLALSPDGADVYATSLNSVVHFDRESLDATAPDLGLDWKPKQKLGGSIVVRGRCDEDCSLAATGTIQLSGVRGELELKKAKGEAGSDQQVKLTLKPTGAAAKKLRKSDARRGRASVKVVATDEDGNAKAKRASIALSRRG